MSRFFEFVATHRSQLIYLVPSVCVAIQLCWRGLRRRPFSRRYIGHRMLTIVAMGCWMAVSDVVYAASARGMFSWSMATATVVALLAILIGAQILVEELYPDENEPKPAR